MLSSEPFAIYVHWPFCKAKCPYCDFNSHVRHQPVDDMAFARSLSTELQWFSERTKDRCVSSVFFGGGTPSLMPPRAVAHVLEEVSRLWNIAPDAEISMEANPTSIEAQNFRGYRSAGVNRVSVGVQSLNDPDLLALGRQHTAREALAAFRLAAGIFPRVSFDLIYARPAQTAEQWRAELGLALSEQRGHMSLYQLTIEPDTQYFRLHERGLLQIPPEDSAAELYEITQDMTAAAGLTAYEVSNHAAPGHESRHNLLYWRYGEYAGVGPGAHSRIVTGGSRRAIATERHPETWRDLVAANGNGIIEDVAVDASGQAFEYLLMGLRIAEGIDLERYDDLADRGIDRARIADLEALGFVDCRGSRLAATARGRRVLNAVIAELAA